MSPRRRLRYRTQVLECLAPWGTTQHLVVERHDGRDGIPWDDLQELKDECLGTDVLAVELYPPAANVVNEVNRRHLWTVPPAVLPIGFTRFSSPAQE